MTDNSLSSIKNFRMVNDWLYRGGQPEADELIHLKNIGVKTIVCLRWNSSAIEQERSRAQELGFNFVYLPLTYWIMPKPNEIEKFFNVLDDQSGHSIFLHCKHGSDRTGMLIAFYRMARQGWTPAQAYQEMKEAGHHKIRMHHFKWAVYSFPKKGKQWFKETE
jgi:tyrosine-protein phosphatase SIW14